MKSLKNLTNLILTFVLLYTLVPSASAMSSFSAVPGLSGPSFDSIHAGGTGRAVSVSPSRSTSLKRPGSSTLWYLIAGHSSLSVAQGKNLKFKRAVVKDYQGTGNNDFEVFGIGDVGDVYRKQKTGAWVKITSSPKMDDLEIGSNGEIMAVGKNGKLYKGVNMSGSSPSWTLESNSLPGGNSFYQVAIGSNNYIWALGEVVRGTSGRAVYIDRRGPTGFVKLPGAILASIAVGQYKTVGVNDLGTLYWAHYNNTLNSGIWNVLSSSGITGTPDGDGHRSRVAGDPQGKIYVINTTNRGFQATGY